MAKVYEEVRDFIILHYVLNEREGSEFWKENRRTVLPDSLARTMELYDQTGANDWDNRALFGEVSFYSIVGGFQRLPRSFLARADFSNVAKVDEIFAAIKAQNLKVANSLPDHGEFMRELHAVRGQPARLS